MRRNRKGQFVKRRSAGSTQRASRPKKSRVYRFDRKANPSVADRDALFRGLLLGKGLQRSDFRTAHTSKEWVYIQK